jgi:hypothetical protein
MSNNNAALARKRLLNLNNNFKLKVAKHYGRNNFTNAEIKAFVNNAIKRQKTLLENLYQVNTHSYAQLKKIKNQIEFLKKRFRTASFINKLKIGKNIVEKEKQMEAIRKLRIELNKKEKTSNRNIINNAPLWTILTRRS